ncbi:hypothetical protein OY671_012767, partial [Metschnikowia pulcherrima]
PGDSADQAPALWNGAVSRLAGGVRGKAVRSCRHIRGDAAPVLRGDVQPGDAGSARRSGARSRQPAAVAAGRRGGRRYLGSSQPQGRRRTGAIAAGPGRRPDRYRSLHRRLHAPPGPGRALSPAQRGAACADRRSDRQRHGRGGTPA